MCNNSNWSGPFDPSNLFFSASDWRRFKSNNSRNPCAQIFDNSQQIMARNYFFPDQNNIPADDQVSFRFDYRIRVESGYSEISFDYKINS